ncbi:MAG: FAD-binding oxidoreductase [Pseudobacteriovorax sp.]|nr:FAD-binding oxidoreductase [Pseudobacteriovorax sp.]
MSDNNIKRSPYWLDEPLILGQVALPKSAEIVVIGSGLSGASSCYWLQEKGFHDITMLDHRSDTAASYRNCGHILNGTVESPVALTKLLGVESARNIWQFSVEVCDDVANTIDRLSLQADYKRDGYLVMAVDAVEDQEIRESIAILKDFSIDNEYLTTNDLENLGFRNVYGARFEASSAQAHPVKFRNGLVKHSLAHGLKYCTEAKVLDVKDQGSFVTVSTEKGDITCEAVVIAANAYSSLLSSYYHKHRLVEPFRGQIICSKPLKGNIPVSYPHSFDHGYEYALATEDNRLMIGGWRQNTEGGETGTYDLTPNETVELGLKNFTKHHYQFDEELEWEYSWSGIMATSRTGLPFIGPTNSPRIYTVSGFTGHGFSWAHGSAKLLANIMAGDDIPEVAKFFDPRPLK